MTVTLVRQVKRGFPAWCWEAPAAGMIFWSLKKFF